jgi:hypothetical protein
LYEQEGGGIEVKERRSKATLYAFRPNSLLQQGFCKEGCRQKFGRERRVSGRDKAGVEGTKNELNVCKKVERMRKRKNCV